VRDLGSRDHQAAPAGPQGAARLPPFKPGTPDDEIDLTPPPDVTGFVAAGHHGGVHRDRRACSRRATATCAQHLRHGLRPRRGPLPTFADAQFLFSFIGEVGSWATQPATTFRLWAKWESRDGVESINPVGGTNGVEVTTGQDVAKLVEAMTGPGKPFKEVTEPILLPDGTYDPWAYISDAYIHRMQVVNAMITRRITNAKISDPSADKIKAGSIAVGEFIKSWLRPLAGLDHHGRGQHRGEQRRHPGHRVCDCGFVRGFGHRQQRQHRRQRD
jgi:hypothetical protein